MNDDEKESLKKLIYGIREPNNGMEKHFLKVIKGDSRPCTKEEKEWFHCWKELIETAPTKEPTLNPSIPPSKNQQSNELLEQGLQYLKNNPQRCDLCGLPMLLKLNNKKGSENSNVPFSYYWECKNSAPSNCNVKVCRGQKQLSTMEMYRITPHQKFIYRTTYDLIQSPSNVQRNQIKGIGPNMKYKLPKRKFKEPYVDLMDSGKMYKGSFGSGKKSR